ncbi:MAG: DUF3322 domain-containing protein [Chloroflexota bacterium]
MITPAEIKQKAQRQYHTFLRASVLGNPFFPLEIRFRKAKASDDYLALRQWVATLLGQSKAERGFGYSVTLAERELRRYGRQSLPVRIAIETEMDFLQFIGKEREFRQWQTAVSNTLTQFPQLQAWLAQYPQRVLPYLTVWDDLLNVCTYFVAHPRPNLYLRELPLPLPTKFIEENKAILRQLLDDLLPATVTDANEGHFERRFGLRYDEPQIRLRLLDNDLRETLGWPAADMGLALSDCAKLGGMNGRLLFIVENKMTFLTLPPVPNGVAVWGKGFQVSLLREVAWLADCDIWYWGDLDVQGFAILSQLRGHWPQTRSFLMDGAMLEKYRTYIIEGKPSKEMILPNLVGEETAVYQRLLAHNWRLEQERIHQEDVVEVINQVINVPTHLPPKS